MKKLKPRVISLSLSSSDDDNYDGDTNDKVSWGDDGSNDKDIILSSSQSSNSEEETSDQIGQCKNEETLFSTESSNSDEEISMHGNNFDELYKKDTGNDHSDTSYEKDKCNDQADTCESNEEKEMHHCGHILNIMKQKYGVQLENINKEIKFILPFTLSIDLSNNTLHYRINSIMTDLLGDTIACYGRTDLELTRKIITQERDENVVRYTNFKDVKNSDLLLSVQRKKGNSNSVLNPKILSAGVGTSFFTLTKHSLEILPNECKFKIMWHLICRYVMGVCSTETVIRLSLLKDRNNLVLGQNIHLLQACKILNGNIFELLLPSIRCLNGDFSRILAKNLEYLKHDELIRKSIRDILYTPSESQCLDSCEYARLKHVYDLV